MKKAAADRAAAEATVQKIGAQADLKPLIKVKFELEHRWDGDLVVAIVHNDGVGADVWAPLKFSGPITGKPNRDVFALWTHTDTSKTKIPKGGEYKLQIAKVSLDGVMGLWHFFYTADGGNVEIAATYTFLFGSTDVVAYETFADVWIYTEPDTTTGTQGFKLTFRRPGEYSITPLSS